MKDLSAYPIPPRSFSGFEPRLMSLLRIGFQQKIEIFSNSDVPNIVFEVTNYVFFYNCLALPRFLLSHLQCLICNDCVACFTKKITIFIVCFTCFSRCTDLTEI